LDVCAKAIKSFDFSFEQNASTYDWW
jgi:hypothetical protein